MCGYAAKGKQTEVGNPWWSPFLFPATQLKLFQQDKLTTWNSQLFLHGKVDKNQNKYFHIPPQRLKKVILCWSPESVLQRHLKGILSAAEQYLLTQLF